MTFSEASKILELHNKWRRYDGFCIPDKHEMQNPTELGIAIDIAVEALKANVSSGCENSSDIAHNYRELNFYRNNYGDM